MNRNTSLIRIVALVSGEGSNLETILNATERGEIPARVVATISNRPHARSLERATRHGVPALVVDHKAYPDRESFDAALARAIDAYQPDLVILAGFMRILSADFVDHYLGRMLNIHPSLLPAYRGLNTHARALEDGADYHGASIHFVTHELDGGPVVIQGTVAIQPGETPQQLAKRVQTIEHQLYPRVINWFANGRLELTRGRVTLDGKPLEVPEQLTPDTRMHST